MRVDRFIHVCMPRFARVRAQRSVALGRVWIDGDCASRSALRVREGQLVTLMRPAPEEPDSNTDVRVLYQDDELLVLNKPAPLTVHATASHQRSTLTAVLKTLLGPDHGYAMAHRLDRETSGVLALARAGPALARLKQAFERHELRKRYLAVVHGALDQHVDVDTPIGPDVTSEIRLKMRAAAHPDAKPAHTAVRPLQRALHPMHGALTLVEAEPATGRQHQIRVHLESLGHRVVGDKLYGVPEAWFLELAAGTIEHHELERRVGFPRHALHASALELRHPTTGRAMRFEAPWPDDLAALMRPTP